MRKTVIVTIVLAALTLLASGSNPSTLGAKSDRSARFDHTVHCALIVEQPLPPGFDREVMKSVTKRREVVTFGLPIPAAVVLRDTSGLALSGTRTAQMKVMSRRADGGIAWLRLDAQLDLEADRAHRGLLLTVGTPNTQGPPLAATEDGRVVVDTGAAQFAIDPTAPGLFSGVWVDETSSVLAAPAGRLVLRPDGAPAAVSHGFVARSVEIADNGPLRAEVVADGAFTGASGGELGARVRLVFTKDSGTVRAGVTIDAAATSHRLEWSLETALGGGDSGAVIGERRDAGWLALNDPSSRRVLIGEVRRRAGDVAGELTRDGGSLRASLPVAARRDALPAALEFVFCFDVGGVESDLVWRRACWRPVARPADPQWWNDSDLLGPRIVAAVVDEAWRGTKKLPLKPPTPLRPRLGDPQSESGVRAGTLDDLAVIDDLAIDLVEWLRGGESPHAPWLALGLRRREIDFTTHVGPGATDILRVIEGWKLLVDLMADGVVEDRLAALARRPAAGSREIGHATTLATAILAATHLRRSGAVLPADGTPEALIGRHLVTVAADETAGLDHIRGYYVGDKEALGPDTVVWAAGQNALAHALGQALRFAGLDHGARAACLGAIEGMARFAASELWYEKSTRRGEFGFLHGTRVGHYRRDDPTTGEFWAGGVADVGALLTLGRIVADDPEIVRRGDLLLELAARRAAEGVADPGGSGRLELVHLSRFSRNYPTWRALSIEIESGREADVLRWSLPADCEDIVVRRSTRSMVSAWLGFDAVRRNFAVDPATSAAFFAAEPVLSVVLPKGATGSVRSTIAKPSQATRHHYRARYLATSPTLRDIREQDRRAKAVAPPASRAAAPAPDPVLPESPSAEAERTVERHVFAIAAAFFLLVGLGVFIVGRIRGGR